MIDIEEMQDIVANTLIKTYFVGAENYQDYLLKHIAHLQNKKVGIIYVSTIKMAEELCKSLNSSDIKSSENFYIVDTKSKKMVRDQQMNNCYYVDSPADLNGIVAGVSMGVKFLVKNSKNQLLLIFDDVDTLFIDNEHDVVNKFIYNFFSRIRKENVPAILICREIGEDKCLKDLLLDLSDGLFSQKSDSSKKKTKKI